MSCSTASLRATPQHNRHTISSATSAARPLTAATSPLTARNMPSPRSSPAMRPTSPLSPGYKNSNHFESLQLPQQRPMHSRTNSSQRRQPSQSLKLPSLPRFHPANFSNHSSVQSTPDGQQNSPQPPVSPRSHQRFYSDAQKQLYFNQREMMLSAAVRGSPSSAGKPVSPRLHPMGSPGPVTPLELEGDEGYLLAGARSSAKDSTAPEELVERLIREETRRSRTTSSSGRPGSR